LTSPPYDALAFDPTWLEGRDLLWFDLHGQAGLEWWLGDGGVVALTAKQVREAELGVAPTADTYQVLRIEVDAGGGDAKFYIDGSLVKTLTASVTTPATLLSPVVVIDTNADASKTVDIDYLYVTARR